jgi:hypothetical protein
MYHPNIDSDGSWVFLLPDCRRRRGQTTIATAAEVAGHGREKVEEGQVVTIFERKQSWYTEFASVSWRLTSGNPIQRWTRVSSCPYFVLSSSHVWVCLHEREEGPLETEDGWQSVIMAIYDLIENPNPDDPLVSSIVCLISFLLLFPFCRPSSWFIILSLLACIRAFPPGCHEPSVPTPILWNRTKRELMTRPTSTAKTDLHSTRKQQSTLNRWAIVSLHPFFLKRKRDTFFHPLERERHILSFLREREADIIVRFIITWFGYVTSQGLERGTVLDCLYIHAYHYYYLSLYYRIPILLTILVVWSMKKNGSPEPRLFPASDVITGTSGQDSSLRQYEISNHSRKMTCTT